MLASLGTPTKERTESAYAPLPSDEGGRRRAPTPRPKPQKPFWRPTTVAASLALVFLAAFTLHGPSTISPSSLIRPIQPSDASLAPWERLRQLNADYDPVKEPFGTGNARLDLYRNEMLAAIREMFGHTSATSVPMLYGEDEELLEDMLCHLDLGCSDFKPIPKRVFSHGEHDTALSQLLEWQDLNAELFELQLSNNEDLRTWAGRRFASSSIPELFDALPSPAHQDDLSRFLALLATGGLFTSPTSHPLQPIADWSRNAVDITDRVLAPAYDPLSPPSLVVGIGWTGYTVKNPLNPLFSRSAGLAFETFGATPGHPVLVDAVRSIWRSARLVEAGKDEGGKGEQSVRADGRGVLHFGPLTGDAEREWAGAGVLTDAVARYLRTRWATSLALISRSPVPVRVGDVLVLPMGSLNARRTRFAKLLDCCLTTPIALASLPALSSTQLALVSLRSDLPILVRQRAYHAFMVRKTAYHAHNGPRTLDPILEVNLDFDLPPSLADLETDKLLVLQFSPVCESPEMADQAGELVRERIRGAVKRGALRVSRACVRWDGGERVEVELVMRVEEGGMRLLRAGKEDEGYFLEAGRMREVVYIAGADDGHTSMDCTLSLSLTRLSLAPVVSIRDCTVTLELGMLPATDEAFVGLRKRVAQWAKDGGFEVSVVRCKRYSAPSASHDYHPDLNVDSHVRKKSRSPPDYEENHRQDQEREEEDDGLRECWRFVSRKKVEAEWSPGFYVRQFALLRSIAPLYPFPCPSFTPHETALLSFAPDPDKLPPLPQRVGYEEEEGWGRHEARERLAVEWVFREKVGKGRTDLSTTRQILFSPSLPLLHPSFAPLRTYLRTVSKLIEARDALREAYEYVGGEVLRERKGERGTRDPIERIERVVGELRDNPGRFVSSKEESLFLQRKNPRKIAWTVVYRRVNKKGVTEEGKAAKKDKESKKVKNPANKVPQGAKVSRAQAGKGALLVLHPPLVYRIPQSWLRLHPGGQHSILHYVGRDASCEIEGYHSGRTVKERMGRWVVGRVETDDEEGGEGWRDMVPPVQLGMWPVPLPTITVTSPPASPAKSRTSSASKTASEPRALTIEMVDPPLSKEDRDKLPLTPAYQAHLRRSHRKLHQRIHSLGLTSPPPFLAGYGPSLLIYSFLALLSIALYRRASSTHSTWDWLAAAVALGAFWHQVTFVAHDAGHTGLTGSWWRDRLWGVGIADFLGGLSIGWWCDNHNVHHLVTNAPEHDPDIQHLPFFAISTRFFDSIRSTYYNRILTFDAFARRFLPHQHKLYYLVMCFARFNLFALSYAFVLTNWPARRSPLFKLRILELVGLVCFWAWFGGVVLRGIDSAAHRWLYLVVSFAVTSPLHVQIVLSHFSQPVSILPPSSSTTSYPLPSAALELLESHPHRQLRTTMDISCPTYLDPLHGGLNFQTPHHLFPRIPRFRFRAVAKEIEKWVEEENKLVEERDGGRYWNGFKLGENERLEYKKMTFVEGNKSVLGVLRDVADQVGLLARVAEKEAKGELQH
ncbi:delta 8-sphingoloid desaturase protein [Rhodotorula toruloides]